MRRILDRMHHMLPIEDHQIAFVLIHEFTIERRACELRRLAVGVNDILDAFFADVRTISQADLAEEEKLVAMQAERLKEPAELDPRTRDIQDHVVRAAIECLEYLRLN